ncbi:thioredoxin (plasmid) [Burkholderia sp. THE68]|uniref:thioredoxin family protein n=1 Tax=Burkholderia sp. THE68 TaxID=758782 RepID=UPI001316092C|nr:thioredoxin family protein [Burkholderia sp. THE68]BBU32033.1 thioredoxin [Burkholderia sp. THE68]
MLAAIKNAAACAGLAACAAIAPAQAAAPVNNTIAPEFAGIDTWLNSQPLTLAQLRGKVVLVDFWTFACGNCVNTLPAVKSWHRKYGDKGLVVVGVHTPEFPFEQDTHNVQRAIERFGITYPVAQDNRYATWAAYGNQYWPAFYLIDKHGRVAYTHVGEGDYAQTEAVIEKLLAAQ